MTISGNQWPSVAIKGHQSEAVRGNHLSRQQVALGDVELLIERVAADLDNLETIEQRRR